MRDRINIKKEMIPYSFDIALGMEKFNLKFDYNKIADLFTVSLKKDGELLCENEPIIYGVPLFQDIYKAGIFPILSIVPYDESELETEITYENFAKTVFLTIDNKGGTV